MSIALPTFFRSNNPDQDRRSDEQDEFNREADNRITLILGVLVQFFGDLDQFQQAEFQLVKTTNPLEIFRFFHGFGVVATNYELLGAQANGGGANTVEWPGRPTNPIPTPDVDDENYITLSFTGRATYLIRVYFDARIADSVSTLDGPS